MAVRLVPVIVAALVLAGCGGGGTSRRDAVSHYIEQVNLIEAKLAAPARTVSTAAQELARPKADYADAARKLRLAGRTMGTLRVRVASVSTPPDARHLRTLLLELLGEESGLARELAAYGTFVPAFQAALGPLGTAGTRLRQTLAAKPPPASSAAALDAYRVAVEAAASRVERLRPPPVSAPIRRNELRTLEGVRDAAAALAARLRAKHGPDLGKLVHRFDVAAAGNGTIAAQRAQIAAVRSFDGKVRGLASLGSRIERERTRLQASF